jgi:uncharacterized membrane protein
MKKSTLFSILTLVVLIPATLYLGTHLRGKMHYLTSTLLIIETMLPFFISFESRRPQARELVTVAVLCALAVASRVAIQIPNFKPIIGIVMIAGIAFGGETGFMTGAVSAFASNFFFSQGPWTPWQMMAYGMAGFLAGVLFHKKRPFSAKPWLQNIMLAVCGFLTMLLVVGPLLDSCTLFTTGGKLTWKYAAAVYSMGFIHNLIGAVSTAATMLLLCPFLLQKLDRLKRKYGMLEC